MAHVFRIVTPPEEVIFSKENAIASRRVLGVEPKDRVRICVCIEREYVEMLRELPKGSISNMVNLGLEIELVRREAWAKGARPVSWSRVGEADEADQKS
ncbi:hypothetical protein ES705_27255 [subsurface metagenome]